MALQVQRASSVKVRIIATLMMMFALVAQPLYGFATTNIAMAFSSTEVSTAEELKQAFADPAAGAIALKADIVTTEKLVLAHPANIYGNGHTITLSGNASGWQGNYVLQVYATDGVMLQHLKLTGGDAGLLVNGSNVTLTGDSIDVSGNEFGGIEVSKGRNVSATPLLTVNAPLINTTEAYKVPTIWEDGVTNTVTDNTQTKLIKNSTIKTNQVQYYLTSRTIAACSAQNTDHSTNLSKWSLGDTRTTGHNVIVANGLRVYTDGATSTDKAAGYRSLNIPLAAIGEPTIDFASTAGGLPGLQLGVDRDGNGTWDGYLVNEGDLYGQGMWWTSKAGFGVQAGGGYASLGTLNDYLAANPQAIVQNFGYSLGSGVKGDVVISRIVAGCTAYTFGLDTVAPSTPLGGAPHATFERDNDFYFTWNAATDDYSTISYEFQSSGSRAVDNAGSLVGAWNSKQAGNDEQKNLTSPSIHSVGAPDGTYYWQVRAIDAAGNASPWSVVWNMTIDSKAPIAPTGLTLKTTSTGVLIPNNGYTNKSDVTAAWASSAEPVTYIYKYWNNVGTSAYNHDNKWVNPLAATSYAGVVNEGEGKHFFCVIAKDRAGNESSCSVDYGFTYDVTAPDVAISGVTPGQTVAGDVNLQATITDTNPMNSYMVITGPNGYSQTSFYSDGRGVHSYLWKTAGLRDGTYKIQFETRDRATNKDAGSVASVSVLVKNPQPVITGENFNTHSGEDYKGLNIGFNIADFKTVTGVSVDLYDADGNLLVTNVHNDKLLALIASGVKQLSTPFIITPGSYVEEYWTLGARDWTTAGKPVKAVVRVSGTNNAGAPVTAAPATLSVLTEADDVTFESLLPVVPPADNTTDGMAAPVVTADNGTLPLIVNELATASPLVSAASIFRAVFSDNADVDTATGNSSETAAVLGTQTTNSSEAANDIAKNVAVIEPSAAGWKLFGLAWYWIVLIIGGVASILYAIVRRRSVEG